jgi:hypothetical protein
MSASPSPAKRSRTTLLVLATAAVFAIVGIYGQMWLFQLLGYGWDIPKGRAIPALVLYFLGGIIIFQRRRSLPLRLFVFLIVSVSSATGWWLTPQNHVSLRDAARLRDELRAELATPPTFEKAFIVDALMHKHAQISLASRNMTDQIDLDSWIEDVAEAIREQYRKTSTEDITGALQVSNADRALFLANSGPFINSREEWVDKAISARKNELEMLTPADWDGFNRTSAGRHSLVQAFPKTRDQLISAEQEWVREATISNLRSIQRKPRPSVEMNPKQTREVCHETDKHLLALKSLDNSPTRFQEHHKLLFHIAMAAVDGETENHLAVGRADIAYGIARKFAVDWFATAEMLGPNQLKRLEELREKCRDRADIGAKGDGAPELTPLPRERETAPEPRIKP